MSDAYITGTGIFLPGEPIDNESILRFIGEPDNEEDKKRSRRIMKMVLAQNGIKKRHYALDEKCKPTFLSSELAQRAILSALADAGLTIADLEMLSMGASIPDLVLPSFGNMVHGNLGCQSLGMTTTTGVCGCGISALQSAWLAIKADLYKTAIAGASERLSPALLGKRFDSSRPTALGVSKKDFYFQSDFLRYMLSDGAGAALIQNIPSTKNLSLKIEWIENRSYSGSYPTCMFVGAGDPDNMKPDGNWLGAASYEEAINLGYFNIRQDVNKLQNIIEVVIKETERLISTGKLIDSEIDWFLPHLSTLYFDKPGVDAALNAGIDIPRDKWWFNLPERGNVGGASVFITLFDALRAGIFEPGQKVLLMLPESARCTIGYALFTVVDGR